MRKRGLPVRTQSDDPSRQTHLHRLGGECLGGSSPELFNDLLWGMRRRKLVRVGRVTQSLDAAQLSPSLQELVERLKFQRSVLSGDEVRPASRRQYSGPLRRASRNWRMGK